MSTARISIVIPAWREATTIRACVEAALAISEDVLVVDAGGGDETTSLAEAAGARVIQASRKGRGPQLHQGALATAGEILLFLHADVVAEPGARAAIEHALDDRAVIGGNFELRFVPESRVARLFTWVNHVRRGFGIYYGDSAIFVRREVYEALGGFRDVPILEDYELVRRLEKRGKTAYIRNVRVLASARRFEAHPFRTLLIWVLIQSLFMVGVPPKRLARLYADLR